jgi:hypothetical protein
MRAMSRGQPEDFAQVAKGPHRASSVHGHPLIDMAPGAYISFSECDQQYLCNGRLQILVPRTVPP